MAKICDICGGTVGIKAFRCLDGAVCKRCYKIVSNNYTTTITKSTLEELKKRYLENSSPLDLNEDGFWITRKIGSFLVLDEKNHKFCILSNHAITREYSKPQIYRFEDLDSYELMTDSGKSLEQIVSLVSDRRNRTALQKLAVRMQMKNGTFQDIVIISGLVHTSSLAFRQGCKYTEQIMRCAERMLLWQQEDVFV